MPYHHLTQADRDRIEALLDAGERQEEIAKILKVDSSTVANPGRRHQPEDSRLPVHITRLSDRPIV
ncbi:MAG: helix-turn-helix domain-containing protein [Candidatus Liptonbacteria bacterium]|nr:helix-turn-helix domain-containing protein [Candidatus Liptonbacteria bacterium]